MSHAVHLGRDRSRVVEPRVDPLQKMSCERGGLLSCERGGLLLRERRAAGTATGHFKQRLIHSGIRFDRTSGRGMNASLPPTRMRR